MNNSDFTTRLIIGGGIILLGIGFLLDQLFNVNFGVVFSKGWPLILVVLGLVVIVRSPKQLLVGGTILMAGVVLEVSVLVGGRFNFWDLWPLILIFIGLSMIFNRNFISQSKIEEKEDRIDTTVLFWAFDKKIVSSNFKGGNITAIFGGGKLDLSKCEISKDGAAINITTIFGGVGIITPENCVVTVTGLGIFGGFEGKRNAQSDSTLPNLKIDGTAIFAGVEVE